MELTDETRQEIVAELKAALARLEDLDVALKVTLGERSEPKPLEEQYVEDTTKRLAALPVEKHVDVLLGLHRCVENATIGRARELVQLEALALITLLNRVLPGVVDRTLDEWKWSEIVEQLKDGENDA